MPPSSTRSALVKVRLVNVPFVPESVVMLADVLVNVAMLAEGAFRLVTVPTVITADPLARLSIVALVDLSVVIVADVNVALERERLDTVKLLTERLVTDALVNPSVVPESVVTLAEVLLSVVIVAEVAVRMLIDALLAIDKLDGFVPSSTTALLLFMVYMRRSAVFTATSAPPARLVRLAVPGTDPGVLLRFKRIVGIKLL